MGNMGYLSILVDAGLSGGYNTNVVDIGVDRRLQRNARSFERIGLSRGLRVAAGLLAIG
jgi:hypothetical protein